METPRDRLGERDAPPAIGEAWLRAVMDESDQDVAAGLTVPLEEILTELDQTASQIEAAPRALSA